MEVRHQVFVSSTFRDLVEERREVMQALLELDCIPAGMELFPAASQAALDLIEDVIAKSDYYVVIVGGRYGSTNPEGISFTELEYDLAVSLGKPVLGFLHGAPGQIPVASSELDSDARERLEKFRAKVEQRLCRYWTTASELGGVVSRSIVQERKRDPRPGWIRADLLGSADVAERLAALEDENRRLREEMESLVGGPLPGTEDLRQGDDQIALEVIVEARGERQAVDLELTATWSELISRVGPLMFDECTEADMQNRLVAWVIEQSATDDDLRREPERWLHHRAHLQGSTFVQIVAQLKALGIIEKSVRKRYVRDTDTYWRLTTYGDHVVTRLTALRRSSSR